MEEELLHLIANQVKLSPYNMIFAMSIVAAMIIQHIPERPLLWGSWVVMVLGSQYYRMRRLPKLPQENHRPVDVRSREAIRINFICSGILALSFLAFPMFTPFEAALQTMLFLAMGVGTIVVVVGWPPYVLAHIWLGLVPLFALWAWSGIAGPGGGYGLALSAIGFSYTYSMWRFGKRLYEMNRDFFTNRTALADALQAAEQSDAAKTRFLAAASHDLRQPIHSLSLLTAALGLQPLGERATSIAGGIGEAVDALSNQLDALLDVSKLDAGVVAVNISVIDLSNLLERLASGMREQAQSAGIDIRVECPPGVLISTDEQLLESILRNLMTNTISHNSDCSLRLTVRRTDACWSLAVEDSGAGIAPQEQLHIFEEFYQINNPERDRSKGLGLGLSIVQRLADLLVLDMRFESTPGVGTRFEFFLPAATDAIAQAPVVSLDTTDLSGLRVIVLDDEHSVREAMCELLQALGCKVSLAGDVPAALNIARNGTLDLALVDYRLRGEDNGLNAVRQLRDIQPDLAAIIVSGDTAPDRLQEVAAAQLPLLSKPVSEGELRKEIARLMAP